MREEQQQEAERIWEQIRDLRDEAPYRQVAVEIITAALKKARDGAIDEMRDVAKKIATEYEVAGHEPEVEFDIDVAAEQLKC